MLKRSSASRIETIPRVTKSISVPVSAVRIPVEDRSVISGKHEAGTDAGVISGDLAASPFFDLFPILTK
jgi:hypothetical protein